MRYAVSDLHGCRKTFNRMLTRIGFTKKDELIIVGDIIDRGPDSVGLINDILNLRKDGFNIICLRGNHEDFLLQARENVEMYFTWIYPGNGGKETLEQYGVTHLFEEDTKWWDKIPEEHWEFYKNMPLFYETDTHVFVHAGFNFYLKEPLKNSTEEQMLWSRNYKYRPEGIGGRRLITGHTPTKRHIIEQAVKEKAGHLIIDNGCVFVQPPDYGNLLCLNVDTDELIFTAYRDGIENDRTERFK